MSKTAWIIFAVITVGILGILVFFSKSSQLDISSVDINEVQLASEKNGNIADHIYGKSDSKVTLIEYGDYQCAPCGSAHTQIKKIVKQYKNQLRFIFRNFPISLSHPNARAAAGAVESAGLQGKYWEMNDKIYNSQSEWSESSGDKRSEYFLEYAKELNLDIDKFNTDISSKSITEKINYDYAIGKKAKVDATPSFYLNGTRLDPSIWGNNTKLKEAIDTELIKAGIDLPK